MSTRRRCQGMARQEQRRQRLPLVVNNSRLYVLAPHHYPNLVSRFMKLMLGRLSADWESTWGHPVALAESFVGPQQYRGTAYKVSGWSQLGPTRGWKRSAVGFYEEHGHPKQVWIRELVRNACAKLRAPELPPASALGLNPVQPRCTARAKEIARLRERLHRAIPEFRRKQGSVYPIAGMLALIAVATFSGVAPGLRRPGRLRRHAFPRPVARAQVPPGPAHGPSALSPTNHL